MKNISLFLMLTTLSIGLSANTLYRAPSSGDKGAYYVIESNSLKNNQFYVLTSRVGKNKAYTDFTELNIDCSSMKYFELAGGSVDGFQEKPTKNLRIGLKDLSGFHWLVVQVNQIWYTLFVKNSIVIKSLTRYSNGQKTVGFLLVPRLF